MSKQKIVTNAQSTLIMMKSSDHALNVRPTYQSGTALLVSDVLQVNTSIHHQIDAYLVQAVLHSTIQI